MQVRSHNGGTPRMCHLVASHGKFLAQGKSEGMPCILIYERAHGASVGCGGRGGVGIYWLAPKYRHRDQCCRGCWEALASQCGPGVGILDTCEGGREPCLVRH